MKKKLICAILCLALGASMLAACGRSGIPAADAAPEEVVEEVPEEVPEETPTPEPTEEPVEAIEPEEEPEPELPEGMMYSLLTGEVVPWEYALKRPFALMINNLNPAVPQSGISGADIMYECYVEGNITRLMAIFQDTEPYTKIGPLRSARHYYLDYMDDYEANYVHFGWSYAAEYKIDVEGRKSINGTNYDGSWGFFRTDDRVAPHNAYVDGSQLPAIAEDKGMRLDYGGYYPVLNFNHDDTVPEEGEDASGTVSFPYPVNNPWFEYDSEEKVYYRFEYGEPHIDMENNEQLKFKNIVVLFANHHQFNEDPVLIDIDLFGTGKGLMFTDGKVQEITWQKDAVYVHSIFYDKDGKMMVLNPGKTMFQVAPYEMNVTWTNAAGDQTGSSYTYTGEPSADYVPPEVNEAAGDF